MIRKALQPKPGNGYMIDHGLGLLRTNRLVYAVRHSCEAAGLAAKTRRDSEHLGDVYVRTDNPARSFTKGDPL